MVNLLILQGAHPNLACTAKKCTSLHLAAATRVSIVESLLHQPGIKINSLDKDGKTPLTYAREYGMLSASQQIKRAGSYTQKIFHVPDAGSMPIIEERASLIRVNKQPS